MIHIGINTVDIQDKIFTAHVKAGDVVKKRDVLSMLQNLLRLNYDITTTVILVDEKKQYNIEYTDKTYLEKDDVMYTIKRKPSINE